MSNKQLAQEKKKLVEKFRKKFHTLYGYYPIVIANNPNDLHSSFIMSLEELENHFNRFLPKKYNKTLTLRSKVRYREIVDLRMIFSYLAHKMEYPIVSIASFTNKHHTSIIHHIQSFNNLIETSEGFRNKYNKILTYIKTQHESDENISAMVYFNKVQHQSQPDVLS